MKRRVLMLALWWTVYMNLIIRLIHLLRKHRQSSMTWWDSKWTFLNLIRSFEFHCQRKRSRFQDWQLFLVLWQVRNIRGVLLKVLFWQLIPESINILLKVLYVLKALSKQYGLWYQQFVQDRIESVSKNERRNIKV